MSPAARGSCRRSMIPPSTRPSSRSWSSWSRCRGCAGSRGNGSIPANSAFRRMRSSSARRRARGPGRSTDLGVVRVAEHGPFSHEPLASRNPSGYGPACIVQADIREPGDTAVTDQSYTTTSPSTGRPTTSTPPSTTSAAGGRRRSPGRPHEVSDEFIHWVPGVHFARIRVESSAGKRVVWHVLDNWMSFIDDQSEWKGTEIRFERAAKDDGTEVRFTHVGLTPARRVLRRLPGCVGDLRHGEPPQPHRHRRRVKPSDPGTLSLGGEAARVGLPAFPREPGRKRLDLPRRSRGDGDKACGLPRRFRGNVSPQCRRSPGGAAPSSARGSRG